MTAPNMRTAIVTGTYSFGRKTILKTQVVATRQEAPVSTPEMPVWYPTLDDLKKHYPEQLGYKCQTLNCPIEERR